MGIKQKMAWTSVFVFINPNRGTLQYSGALNSIFIVRKDGDNLKLPNNLAIKEHDGNLIELLPIKCQQLILKVLTPLSQRQQ